MTLTMGSLGLETLLLIMMCVYGGTSKTCSAGKMIQSLDNSTDPCVNFYQFACGGWQKRHFLPSYRHRLDHLDTNRPLALIRSLLAETPKPTDIEALRKAKMFYTSCINYKPFISTSIVNIVRETFGSWPLTFNDSCVEEGFNLETFLVKAVLLGVQPMFTLTAVQHDADIWRGKMHEIRRLNIAKPELGWSYEKDVSKADEKAYMQIYANRIYSYTQRFQISNYMEAKRVANEIVSTEETLARVYNLHHKKEESLKLTLHTLQRDYGKFLNWTRFVSTLAALPDMRMSNIGPSSEVYVSHPEYMKYVVMVLRGLSPRKQANFIIWRVIDSLDSVLIQEENKLSDMMIRDAAGFTVQPMPDESCAVFVSKSFHLVAHRLLYDAYLPPDKKNKVEEMKKQLSQEFASLVVTKLWINRRDYIFFQNKNEYMKLTFMYYDRVMDNSYLDGYYSNVSVDEQDFINNVVSVRKNAFIKDFKSIEQYNEFESSELPHKLVGQYDGNLNHIEYTAVLLQPPFFTDNVPMVINYAGIGFSIAHEIIHGFDDDGYKIDKNRMIAGLTDQTIRNFSVRANCLIDQYSTYFDKAANKTVNGRLTLNENIADNGGIKLAYGAYKRLASRRKEPRLPNVPLSNEQQFFVHYAQTWCDLEDQVRALEEVDHSPREFRIIGSVQNSRDFARVFNCPVGSPMNPVKKCEVW